MDKIEGLRAGMGARMSKLLRRHRGKLTLFHMKHIRF